VENIPTEQRGDLTKYVDQLGDIWYDRAERAENLLQLSHAINDSTTISADLKSRILEQINLIYTNGDETLAERTLAKSVISDFLAKSPNRTEIFGDEDNTGLIDEMIDDPEYYEENLAIARRIYEEYVQFDTDLSDEAKNIIKGKLIVLAGAPPSGVEPG
jgi:hypothetical protein